MAAEPPSAKSPSDLAREQLNGVRQALLHLHKTLIDSERLTYESAFGKVALKGDFLQLLIQDPWFAWLRPLSQLVALIDETIDAKEPLTAEIAKGLINQARLLLKPSDASVHFDEHYRDALQRDPDVVLAHAEALRLLQLHAAPRPSSPGA